MARPSRYRTNAVVWGPAPAVAVEHAEHRLLHRAIGCRFQDLTLEQIAGKLRVLPPGGDEMRAQQREQRQRP